MNSETGAVAVTKPSGLLLFIMKHKQTIKIVVYSLLIFNFGFYIYDEARMAASILQPSPTFLEYATAYVTSVDLIGWFGLLFLFELETYWLEDDFDNSLIYGLMQVFRVLFYVIICHTVYSYGQTLVDLSNATILSSVGGLCSLAGDQLSFTHNLSYQLIDLANCASTEVSGELYKLEGEPVVTDTVGYDISVKQAWSGFIESVGWLSISILLTFVMILQNKGIYNSPWIRGANIAQTIVYLCIIGCAISWSVYGHYVYTWDTMLWIGGFAAIDLNLKEWRDELEESAA